MSFNLATMLRESAIARPDKLALIADDGSGTTYGRLDAGSAAVAAGLRRRGLRPGDRVVLQLPNGNDFVVAYFAVVRAGMVAVPINPMLRAGEIGHVLDDSGARLLITHTACAREALHAARRRPHTAVVVAGAAAASPGAPPDAHFESLGAAADPDLDPWPTAGDDTAVLMYTSGTTGKPKGAELTHFQLFMNCTISSEIGGIGAEDVALTALPLFHIFGLSAVLNTVVRRTASVVLLSRFEPAEALDLMREHDVTLFYGVPTMFVGLLDPLERTPPIRSLRIAYSGGAAIPAHVIRQFEAGLPGAVVLEGYGLSETASTVSFNYSRGDRKYLSVGRPLWGVDVRIVDLAGQPLPNGPDHVGEIAVRGHNVMKAYYRRPQETADAIRDGWFSTGDLGFLDDDGYLFIVDRKKDLIIRGGYNVYPREVEEVLYQHPAVLEAAVVGLADPRLGEEVVAVVSLVEGARADETELIGYCRERMAGYKYPRQISVMDALPKGPTGKILKSALRAPVP